ncbi:hypothetical protein RFI_12379, partial [Reticulomyxa filosa]
MIMIIINDNNNKKRDVDKKNEKKRRLSISSVATSVETVSSTQSCTDVTDSRNEINNSEYCPHLKKLLSDDKIVEQTHIASVSMYCFHQMLSLSSSPTHVSRSSRRASNKSAKKSISVKSMKQLDKFLAVLARCEITLFNEEQSRILQIDALNQTSASPPKDSVQTPARAEQTQHAAKATEQHLTSHQTPSHISAKLTPILRQTPAPGQMNNNTLRSKQKRYFFFFVRKKKK